MEFRSKKSIVGRISWGLGRKIGLWEGIKIVGLKKSVVEKLLFFKSFNNIEKNK